MNGRPVIGGIFGLLFGLFLGPTLWLWGVIPLDSPAIVILPLVGLVLGILFAAWAPFGSAEPAPATATPTDEEE